MYKTGLFIGVLGLNVYAMPYEVPVEGRTAIFTTHMKIECNLDLVKKFQKRVDKGIEKQCPREYSYLSEYEITEVYRGERTQYTRDMQPYPMYTCVAKYFGYCKRTK